MLFFSWLYQKSERVSGKSIQCFVLHYHHPIMLLTWSGLLCCRVIDFFLNVYYFLGKSIQRFVLRNLHPIVLLTWSGLSR